MNETHIDDDEIELLGEEEKEEESTKIDPTTLDVTPETINTIVQQRKLATLLAGSPVDRDELALCDSLTNVAQKQQRMEVDKNAGNSNAELAKVLAEVITSTTGALKKEVTEEEQKDVKMPEAPEIPESDEQLVITDQLLNAENETIELNDIMKKE